MFYRRKIILALIQVLEGHIPKISLQKLLFLFANRQETPDYDFVPYRYGCYSFSANADLKAMVKHNQLSEDTTGFSKVGTIDYIKMLKESDKKVLMSIKNNYAKLSPAALMKLTYLNYQYYAIKSVKAREILSDAEYAKIEKAKPINNRSILYTIGYEGISLEEYLNRLIKNDVKVLIDVRKNALSMKFGFSKTQMKLFCTSLNIEYLHVPEVGIQSDQRQELKTQADYDNLFQVYKRLNLNETKSQQEQILKLLKENHRIALTCFEANICQCHRKHLAEAIMKIAEGNCELKHI